MIPKIIHYCWIGGKPLPESAKKCIKSWKKYCPDYQIIEWNESNYDFTKVPYMKEAYEAKKWGFVPDYARLDIVYQNGGIYLDVDVEILKPLDLLLIFKGFAGFESNESVALGLGFGAEPNSPLIKRIMDSYLDKHFIKPDGNVDLTPAPQLNTKILKNLGLKCDGTMQTIEDFTILPKEYLCPRVGYSGKRHITENTLTDHHFNASWADTKSKKQWAKANREEDRLYERNRRKYLWKRLKKKITRRVKRFVQFFLHKHKEDNK